MFRMINNDPMTMTDEEMITEFLDVIRICRKNDNMKLAFAETIWALRQYRSAEIFFYLYKRGGDVTLYADAVEAFTMKHPNWPEEAK